ncbi:hypothetical protein [Bradyrhizobium sp. BRP56]|uniref:hypothetical protein n=1 Tax=Bradyrhizobium sp. BRP56 TaxID=2793819 RepID=UPI001CD528D2|nr:hypothetical protein [Bradyrhizobium sp. BRP56]MCA1398662.1 hypothetical protein [Bradyrhizobium sp. BRP56]
MTVRSQAIHLLGVDDRFEALGHVVLDDKGDAPELVMLNGEPFIACGKKPAVLDPTVPLQYRKVRPFRFVRKALP